MTPHPTTLDLDGILAKGWVDRGDIPAAEFDRAERFYTAMRVHDARLLAVRAQASALIAQWTGHSSRDVGSFGTRLNLENSDLDLGIGEPVDHRPALMAALDGRARFLGERRTSLSTTRLVFAFDVDGVEIDLSAFTTDDFALAGRMLDQIDEAMTPSERICHTWVKHLLHEASRPKDYAAWKLVTYARFCPEFNWVPSPAKAGS
ncbi:hypothetical protein [Frankia gtarii]|uniref:hypothetical protein n=1 Tax=Frankia gtarii TaxID=2950102 RepID=UPI0021BF7755|nr:hypothetical protein [Frankia gtarii]